MTCPSSRTGSASCWASSGRPTRSSSSSALTRSPPRSACGRWSRSLSLTSGWRPSCYRDLIARIGRRAIKRRNAWIGGLAAGLVVAIGLAGVAVWQSYVADAQRKQVIEREMNRRAALARDLDNSLTADRRMSAISAVQTSPRRSLPLMAHLPLYASYGTPTHGDVALRCRTCTSVQTTPCWRSRWSLVPRD